MKEEVLYLTREQFWDLTRKEIELSRLKANLEKDSSDFIAWAQKQYGLEWYTKYRIKVIKGIY